MFIQIQFKSYFSKISFKKNTQIEWNVQIKGKLFLCLYMLFVTSIHNFFHILSLISRAALFVKVTQSMFGGLIFFSFIMYSTLVVRVAVFQLHAQAIIKRGHSILSLAFSCSLFRFIFLFLKNISSVYTKYKKIKVLVTLI